MVLNTRLKKPKISLPDKYVLATIHRQENTDSKQVLNDIFVSLINLSNNINILFPMHPRTNKKLKEINMYEKVINNLTVIEPQSYNNLLYLIKHCRIVISDSGGIPKEAAFLGKPSIYIGNKIIWYELYEQNWSYLLTPSNAYDLLKTYNLFTEIIDRKKLKGFGNGKASEKIAKFLSKL